MSRRFIPSLLLVALLAAPLALAQDEPAATEPAAVTIDLVGHGDQFFTLEGESARNPTLNVPPGAEVTINLRSESGFHNIHVEGFPASPIIGPGDTTSVTFTAPESGTLTYQCDPHAPAMGGIIQVGAASAPAPTAAPTEYTVVGHQETGGAFFFTIEGQTARNPTLYVAPGQEITVTFYSATGFHNLHILDTDAKTGIVGPGQDPVVVTFTAPAEGTTWRYQCDPHAPGMAGNIVAGAPPSNGAAPPPDNEITGPTVDLATLGYPECAGWLVPQSVTRGTAGGPVVRDYVAQCHAAGEEREPEADPYAGADLVIPTMWALIAVGVLGVFYVHKHYRP